MQKLRTVVLSAVAVALVVAPATAQTAEEVVGKYQEAIGGADAWKSLTSMRASGTLDVMGMVTGPFTITQKRPAMARIEITVQGMDIIQAFDGENAWQVMPMMGITEPTPADPETAQQIIEQADLDGPLIGWQEDGYRVELLGSEMLNGEETTKLEVTDRDGFVTYFYLNGQYLPVKLVAVRSMQGVDTELTTTLGDYQEVDGLLFPFFIEIDTPMGAQTLMFESIEVNVPVDESIFSMSAGR